MINLKILNILQREVLEQYIKPKNITLEFLNEINLYLKMNKSFYIVRIYDIAKDPKTSNFMMVMQYAENGNLRQRLNNDFNSLSWCDKLAILRDIASGLNDIHKKELTHRDFYIKPRFNIKVPQLIVDIFKQCADADPSKRPTAKYL
ncbi:kinase-like domain-containing protein [Glomus cerebriforme]|uniref:Kinase-like domain-containing protein n=1 Tax=Glomus cerebriforme TaxID=658196 RepID=A0A397T873_9GLOM|nr:kinase-like domain-containing protein [Glomus cerebriforme]